MDMQELLYFIYMDEQEKKKAASDDEVAGEDKEKAGK